MLGELERKREGQGRKDARKEYSQVKFSKKLNLIKNT